MPLTSGARYFHANEENNANLRGARCFGELGYIDLADLPRLGGTSAVISALLGGKNGVLDRSFAPPASSASRWRSREMSYAHTAARLLAFVSCRKSGLTSWRMKSVVVRTQALLLAAPWKHHTAPDSSQPRFRKTRGKRAVVAAVAAAVRSLAGVPCLIADHA